MTGLPGGQAWRAAGATVLEQARAAGRVARRNLPSGLPQIPA